MGGDKPGLGDCLNLLTALIHSPLVGPFTWSMVADELRDRGMDVHVPDLANPTKGPFWEQHARSAAAQLGEIDADARIVLAGHSGSGVLLPAIARELECPIAAYLFVDAGLPRGGEPRMAGQFGQVLRDLYSRGERFPNWTDDALAGILPNAGVRARVLDELRPQPWEFWQEPLPEIAVWPDSPCAYLLFSSAYTDDTGTAESLGWPLCRLSAGHFHLLVDPKAVAVAMLDLLDELGIQP